MSVALAMEYSCQRAVYEVHSVEQKHILSRSTWHTYTIIVVPDISIPNVAHAVVKREPGPTDIKTKKVFWEPFVLTLSAQAQLLGGPVAATNSLEWINMQLAKGRAVSFLAVGKGDLSRIEVQTLIDSHAARPSQLPMVKYPKRISGIFRSPLR